MKKRIAVCGSLAALLALICAAGEVMESCRRALSLCAELIIPSLFPFFVLSILLSRLGLPELLGRLTSGMSRRLFNVSGAGASALIMGLTGGYPLGAAYIADMRRAGSISAGEAERLMGFCNNSGPAFIVGAVGAGVFVSPRAGLYLYGVHIAAAVITGLILRTSSPAPDSAVCETAAAETDGAFAEVFSGAVKQALVSMLNVCAFVVCFTVLVGLLDADGFFSLAVGRISAATGWELHRVRALLTGILELGSGVGAMRTLGLNAANLALAAFLVGWGGISVHFQTMAVIAESGIKGALHFAGRLISASISAVLAYFLYGLVF